jgi:hypothetical protein
MNNQELVLATEKITTVITRVRLLFSPPYDVYDKGYFSCSLIQIAYVWNQMG